jgi:mannose-6-phosphate isomerase-like protein (cupin superfamily)
METKRSPDVADYLAPDGSEIRLLVEVPAGGLAHCRLPAGATSKAVAHRSVDELWCFTAGNGQVWRKSNGREEIVEVGPMVSLTIRCGTHFQFRNTGEAALELLIATLPRWPGKEEAFSVVGCWPDPGTTGP